MSEPELPQVGTRDFFADAMDLLQDSDTPHVLVVGYHGFPFKYTSANVTKESISWFRREINAYLDDLERRSE